MNKGTYFSYATCNARGYTIDELEAMRREKNIECGYIIDRELFEEPIEDNSQPAFSLLVDDIVNQQDKEKEEKNIQIAKHQVTSGYNFEGYQIVKYNGVSAVKL